MRVQGGTRRLGVVNYTHGNHPAALSGPVVLCKGLCKVPFEQGESALWGYAHCGRAGPRAQTAKCPLDMKYDLSTSSFIRLISSNDGLLPFVRSSGGRKDDFVAGDAGGGIIIIIISSGGSASEELRSVSNTARNLFPTDACRIRSSSADRSASWRGGGGALDMCRDNFRTIPKSRFTSRCVCTMSS